MLKRRTVDGFNLSFLDVMACGLGAVILLFMLVKFNAEQVVSDQESQRLSSELTQAQQELEQITKTLLQRQSALKSNTAALGDSKKQSLLLSQQAQKLRQTIAQQQAKLSALEQQVSAAQAQKSADPIALAGSGEEQYLLGLKVEGRHIGILLDYSASMTDEALVEIIKRKVGSDLEKQQAPKWQRTLRVVQWLLARAPLDAMVSVVGFNQKAAVIGPSANIAVKNAQAMAKLVTDVKALVPEHGTNLQAALIKMSALNPNLTHLYVVTDGLPTLGEQGSGLSSFAKCGSFFGKSTTISGKCREQLFVHTIKKARIGKNVQVNVILMPLEGDPQAAPAYWQWANSQGGLLISPAPSWP